MARKPKNKANFFQQGIHKAKTREVIGFGGGSAKEKRGQKPQ